MTDDDELGEAIRDMHYQELADGLKRLGVPQQQIDDAVAQAKATGDDTPITALAKSYMTRP